MKTLALIPALATALYGAQAKGPCTIDPVVERVVRAEGYTPETFEPKTADQLPGNLLPGCYTTVKGKGRNSTMFYSQDGLPLGIFFEHDGQYVWRDRSGGSQRVYASSDPQSFLYEQMKTEEGQRTVWGHHHRPVYRRDGDKLIPISGSVADTVRGYVGGNKFSSVPGGTYVVVSNEELAGGKATRNGFHVMFDGTCGTKCSVEPFSFGLDK